MASKVLNQKLNVKVLLDFASLTAGHKEGAVRSFRRHFESQVDDISDHFLSEHQYNNETYAHCYWESCADSVITAFDIHPREMAVVSHVSGDVLVRLW